MKEILETGNKELNKSLDLQFSCERIEGKPENGIARGSFTVECLPGEIMKGHVTCIDPRMECTPSEFSGNRIEIQYCFDGRKLSGQEEINGVISFVSNRGEAVLPFTISSIPLKLTSSLGEIRNLFHFANLARTSWEEAVKLFFDPSFEQILLHAQEEDRQLYRGLKDTGKEQCVEEFLLAIRKKAPVVYYSDNIAPVYENITEDRKEEIQIHRSGWGYTALVIEKEGDFFSLKKDELGDADFMGNICHLPIYFHANRLHQGKNYGRIFLHHAYGSITLTLTVHQNQHHRMRVAIEKRRKLRQMKMQLTQLYVDFRSKKLAASRWKKETEELLEKMRALDERSSQIKLFIAHLYITSDKIQEAGWMLNKAARNLQEEKEPITYAYYLYLNTLLRDDEEYQHEVREKIEKLYYQNDGSWQLAWLILYLSKKLHRNPQKKWNFLQEVFALGCTSPVLYTEAVMLLNYQPTLLMELAPIELRILEFGQKRDILSSEVKGVLQYLSLREKEYSPALLRILRGICEKQEDTSMLQALCSLLIKGNKKGGEYFPWYEKAVYAGLKITRLYEYYMMSLDRKKNFDIPKMVLMYFSYETSLSYPNAAYLYRYVFENRNILEDLYLAYAPRIERFLLKQLYGGKINKDLGYLYENLLLPNMLTLDNARALEKLIFIHSYQAEKKDAERLIVVQRHLKEEQIYELYGGKGRCHLAGKNLYLLREDKRGQRFVVPEEEEPKPFLSLTKVADAVARLVEDSLGIALYACEEHGGWQPIRAENEQHFRFLSECPEVLEEEKQEIRSRLLDYYHENDKIGFLDNWLEECEPDALAKKERKKLIHYLVARGYYEKAYRFVQVYGPEEMDPKALVRITTYMLEEENKHQDILLWLVHTAFQKGKYNIPMLTCLSEYYQGTCQQLVAIFKAAYDFELDVYKLSERLLTQMMYTQTIRKEAVEIFKSYVAGGAKTSLEAAFLTWWSRAYVENADEMDPYLIRAIKRVYRRGVKLELINHIAYLKYYAFHQEEIEQDDHQLIDIFLRELVLEKGWVFPFLMQYQDYPGMEVLKDRSFVFHEALEEGKVILHYAKKETKESREIFQRDDMESLQGGVFVKEFILFCGEEIKYYITSEKENQEQLMASGSLAGKENDDMATNSRYCRINQMAALQTQGKIEEIEELLEEYLRMEYVTGNIFHL